MTEAAINRGVIVYATPYYPPYGAGGAELTASLHARLLAEQGQPAIVVTPNYGAAPHEIVNGVEIVRHDWTSLSLGEQVAAHRFSSLGYQRYLANEIVAATRGRTVRCIHAQHQFVLRGAARAAMKLGVPLIGHLRDTSQICSLGAVCLLERDRNAPPAEGCGVWQHAICHQTRFAPTYLARYGRMHRAARLAPATFGWRDWRMRGHAFSQAARVAFASDHLRQLYETLPPFRRTERNRTVYAPALPPALHRASPPAVVRSLKAEGRLIVLHVGKASRGKGCDVLFAAWRNVVRAHPAARLVMAGNIDPGAWDIDEETTILLGFVDRATVEELYDCADIVVLPATWPEPLGWATLDAARHGKPIVATRVGGIPEAVVDGETGLLVERLDPSALAWAISTLIDNRERRMQLGQQARARVFERFGEKAVTQQLLALYAGL